MTIQHKISLYQVDTFTNKAFSGNPAAVCLLPEARNTDWMQAVATEMNLSETVFVTTCDDGFTLRWFTPVVEINLCGHATLATAHVLWEQGILRTNLSARFHTKSGILQAKLSAGWIQLDFPAELATELLAPKALLVALNLAETPVLCTELDYLVVLASANAVNELSPDFSLLKSLNRRGVIVTAPASEPGLDFVSRFFAPALGIDEDPVTGAAHCVLYPYWCERLNKASLTAFQASKRGGLIKLQGRGTRVLISGQAVTVMSGELHA
ncbi:MAG TPA: PhzF family phenazine biosynthesis protein [Crenotrichaceae bacterium]|nr:PhzF family phenazine biosynthesis protein [Crenotrichaceae bacterium]